MSELFGKHEVLKMLEEMLADRSRALKRELFAEDLVTTFAESEMIKIIYDEIKGMHIADEWISTEK